MVVVATMVLAGFFHASAAGDGDFSARPLHVLFIGNSYTYYNSLPSIFEQMAVSAGFPKPLVDSSVPGGWQLIKHLHGTETLAKIDGGAKDGARWDVVVLQEQSRTPALAEESDGVRQAFLNGVTGLYDRIKGRNPDARVVLYETWARHTDVWRNSPKEVQGVGRNPEEMQARIRKWNETAARQIIQSGRMGSRNSVLIARVGDFWELHYKSGSPIRLHIKDGSHPELAGSCLAGLVMFATIYDTSPLKVTWQGNLPEATVAALRSLVAAHPGLLARPGGLNQPLAQ